MQTAFQEALHELNPNIAGMKDTTSYYSSDAVFTVDTDDSIFEGAFAQLYVYTSA
jgi:hypothetical protein